MEDVRGRFNSKGHYLAQVDVQIVYSLNNPNPNLYVGNLGCPPER
jgi:hypothetical protein